MAPGCCEWCTRQSGRYEYPDKVPADVYKRHDNCKCTVEYVTNSRKQNVHTKQQSMISSEDRKRMAELSEKGSVRLSPEEAAAAESKALEVMAQKSGRMLTDGAKSGIIRESGKPKPITEITDKAIESVPKVNISGYTDEQCAMIQKQHKELLEYSRKNNENKEVAFVFDSSLESRKEFMGSDDKVDFGRGLYGSNITVLHNHPRNSSYSVTDIIFFGGNTNVKTLTIVKNNGKVEYLTKSEEFDPAVFKLEYDRLYRKIVKTGTDSEKDKFVKALLNKSKSGVIWSERT